MCYTRSRAAPRLSRSGERHRRGGPLRRRRGERGQRPAVGSTIRLRRPAGKPAGRESGQFPATAVSSAGIRTHPPPPPARGVESRFRSLLRARPEVKGERRRKQTPVLRRAADTPSRRPPLRRRLRPEVDGEQTPRPAARPSANVSGPGQKSLARGAASAAKGSPGDEGWNTLTA